jgi:hypothetical protein
MMGMGQVVEGKLKLVDKVPATVAGREIQVARFDYKLPSAQFCLWVDRDSKILVAENNTDRTAFVREGYVGLYSGRANRDTNAR